MLWRDILFHWVGSLSDKYKCLSLLCFKANTILEWDVRSRSFWHKMDNFWVCYLRISFKLTLSWMNMEYMAVNILRLQFSINIAVMAVRMPRIVHSILIQAPRPWLYLEGNLLEFYLSYSTPCSDNNFVYYLLKG